MAHHTICPHCKRINVHTIFTQDLHDFLNETIICPSCGLKYNVSQNYLIMEHSSNLKKDK